eukprot:jgi/Bigna1/78960/fgenesh1_pg.58_\
MISLTVSLIFILASLTLDGMALMYKDPFLLESSVIKDTTVKRSFRRVGDVCLGDKIMSMEGSLTSMGPEGIYQECKRICKDETKCIGFNVGYERMTGEDPKAVCHKYELLIGTSKFKDSHDFHEKTSLTTAGFDHKSNFNVNDHRHQIPVDFFVVAVAVHRSNGCKDVAKGPLLDGHSEKQSPLPARDKVSKSRSEREGMRTIGFSVHKALMTYDQDLGIENDATHTIVESRRDLIMNIMPTAGKGTATTPKQSSTFPEMSMGGVSQSVRLLQTNGYRREHAKTKDSGWESNPNAAYVINSRLSVFIGILRLALASLKGHRNRRLQERRRG